MQEVGESQAVATWRNIELSDHTIHQHVLEGMKLTHLGVGFDEILTCVINEEAEVSKLKFLDGVAGDREDFEDPQARQDADFVLLTGAIRRLNQDLKQLLGGYAGD